MKRRLTQEQLYTEIVKEKVRKGEPLEYTTKAAEEFLELYKTYLKKRKNENRSAKGIK